MIAAGIGAVGIDSAAPAAIVKEDTVAIRPPGQGEGAGARVEMFDKLLFHEFSGYKF